ncbi:hypothetical protein J4E82_007982 [Alternaria postmessia]|uniref:uncharacterized protein n=1 Tax=Alternaria postmessia TaxID=1187938 RepID=UPI002224363C|nr:uncharacterized protein J4E82_007982 [Alternaria postmessia]KAI5373338.1 hypothetical protein J4E82_007982 [Alternaria postmessia]
MEIVDDISGVPTYNVYSKGLQARQTLRKPYQASANFVTAPAVWPGSTTYTGNSAPQDRPPVLQQDLVAAPVPPPRVREPVIEPRRPGKTRLGLPITLHNQDVLATVLACADTGADVNIMSDDVAKTLGYSEYDVLSERKQFALANGKIVEAIGQIESVCSFGIETEPSATMTCIFYILLKAAMPIIVGLDFLEQTKTMTEHRDRLVRVKRPAYQALSVCSVGKPRRLLECYLDFRETLAIPDTGSEINLISSSFAYARGFDVYPGEELIELADGSISITAGFVRAEVSIYIPNFHPDAPFEVCDTIDLFLLDDLIHDLIVGEEALTELGVFSECQHALIPAPHDFKFLEVNGIRHLGPVDRFFSRMKQAFNGASSNGKIDENVKTYGLQNYHTISRKLLERLR